WRRTEQGQWVYGLLGRHNSDGTVTYVPTGRALYKFVTIRNANGAQTVVVARDDAGVPHQADLPVRMKNEHGTYVIESVTRREDLAIVAPPPPSGLPIHTHDDRYFRETEHVSSSAGASDAGKPVVLDAAGLLDDSFLNDEHIEDLVAAQLTGNTGRVQFSYNDTTGELTAILDVSAADKILY